MAPQPASGVGHTQAGPDTCQRGELGGGSLPPDVEVIKGRDLPLDLRSLAQLGQARLQSGEDALLADCRLIRLACPALPPRGRLGQAIHGPAPHALASWATKGIRPPMVPCRAAHAGSAIAKRGVFGIWPTSRSSRSRS